MKSTVFLFCVAAALGLVALGIGIDPRVTHPPPLAPRPVDDDTGNARPATPPCRQLGSGKGWPGGDCEAWPGVDGSHDPRKAVPDPRGDIPLPPPDPSVVVPSDRAPSWWDRAWSYRRRIAIVETAKIPRANEPVYVAIAGTDGKITSCTKEVRIVDQSGKEVPSQVDQDSVEGGSYSCKVALLVSARGLDATTYYAYYGNRGAAAPSYASPDPNFSVSASLLRNAYYKLPVDSFGFVLPSFSPAGNGSYDIAMATDRGYCDNQRWMFAAGGHSIGSGTPVCSNPASSWSVSRDGAFLKEVSAGFGTNPAAATLFWKTRLFPSSRYIETALEARLSGPLDLTTASLQMVPSHHTTAWDSSNQTNEALSVNENSSWGTWGSAGGSVVFGNVRSVDVALSKSLAIMEPGVGFHHDAYLLALASNRLACPTYPCTFRYALRLIWTTDQDVPHNRETGRMLDNPLTVEVAEEEVLAR